MEHRIAGRRAGVIALIILALGVLFAAVPGAMVAPARAATKTIYLPTDWKNGNVPWVASRTRESANFALYWGDRSGTDPTTAASAYRFDPADVLNQLETLYSYYVDTMKFTPETGLLAQYKIMVIVTGTWSDATYLDAWATGGSADGMVGVINIATGAAQPGSWGLAHELAHVFQNYTFLGKSGVGFVDASAGTFWETSAEYMSMQVYPDGGAGDLTRFLRTENLAYSSSRHHYGNWMLMQYIVDQHGGIPMFNRIWNEAKSNEHPLETYRRINNLTQTQLAAQIAEYAQHQVTYDYSNRSHFIPFVNNVYGAGFINAYNGVPVDAVNQATGHYAIPDALAPSDFGYNKIKLVPSTDGGLVQVHFKGHVASSALSGWSYGFVAVKNGTPRYSPVYTASDATISFQTQAGEKDVYLVVTGAPTAVHHYGFNDGYTKNYRYPYEFRVAGATPSGYEPGYTKPAATGGGHWHSNGGGWVSGQATVASTAYVGPRAAVYGNATVSGNARIEGLAWVNSGGSVSGNAVVKDNALIQGGVSIGGTAVVGGDAEPAGTCTSGTYLTFNPDRPCDGKAGESEVTPTHGTFTDDELAIGTTTTPTATATPTATPTTPAATTPAATRPAATTPAATTPAATTPAATTPAATSTSVPTTTAPAPTGGCTATYRLVQSWGGGFIGEVQVTAGSADTSGWTVTWSWPDGQAVTNAWGGVVTSNGAAVTAQNAAWNGALKAGVSTTLGFTATAGATNRAPVPTCTAT